LNQPPLSLSLSLSPSLSFHLIARLRGRFGDQVIIDKTSRKFIQFEGTEKTYVAIDKKNYFVIFISMVMGVNNCHPIEYDNLIKLT